jgi:probable HAF family extracellular repeat protein
MQDLGTLGGSTSEANDISDSGIVVGVSFTSQLEVRAFKWQNGQMTNLGSPTLLNSRAYAVNDSAQIVGNYSDGTTTQPLFWDSAGVMYDLNTVLDPITGTGWNLRHAFNINNRGQIVGQGIHDGALRAYLLTPVPEPPPTVLLLIAASAAAMVRRLQLNQGRKVACNI